MLTTGLINLAIPAVTADHIAGGINVTALGSTQGTATALDGRNVLIGTSAASTGVLLPSVSGWFVTRNASGQTINYYPPVGGTINGGSVNAAVTLANSQTRICFSLDGINWFTLSAAS